jgi:hypothetical protein
MTAQRANYMIELRRRAEGLPEILGALLAQRRQFTIRWEGDEAVLCFPEDRSNAVCPPTIDDQPA